MKKFLALMLSLIMVMTFTPMVAWADEPEPEPEEEYSCSFLIDATYTSFDNEYALSEGETILLYLMDEDGNIGSENSVTTTNLIIVDEEDRPIDVNDENSPFIVSSTDDNSALELKWNKFSNEKNYAISYKLGEDEEKNPVFTTELYIIPCDQNIESQEHKAFLMNADYNSLDSCYPLDAEEEIALYKSENKEVSSTNVVIKDYDDQVVNNIVSITTTDDNKIILRWSDEALASWTDFCDNTYYVYYEENGATYGPLALNFNDPKNIMIFEEYNNNNMQVMHRFVEEENGECYEFYPGNFGDNEGRARFFITAECRKILKQDDFEILVWDGTEGVENYVSTNTSLYGINLELVAIPMRNGFHNNILVVEVEKDVFEEALNRIESDRLDIQVNFEDFQSGIYIYSFDEKNCFGDNDDILWLVDASKAPSENSITATFTDTPNIDKVQRFVMDDYDSPGGDIGLFDLDGDNGAWHLIDTDSFVTVTSLDGDKYEFTLIGDDYENYDTTDIFVDGKIIRVQYSCGITYDIDAVENVYDYQLDLVDMIDSHKKYSNDRVLNAVVGEDEVKNTKTVLSPILSNNLYNDGYFSHVGEVVQLDVKLKKGYVIDDIFLNGAPAQHYSIENESLYYAYDGNDNQLNIINQIDKYNEHNEDELNPGYVFGMGNPYDENTKSAFTEITVLKSVQGGEKLSNDFDNSFNTKMNAFISSQYTDIQRIEFFENITYLTIYLSSEETNNIEIITRKVEPEGDDVYIAASDSNVKLGSAKINTDGNEQYSKGLSENYGKNAGLVGVYDLSASGTDYEQGEKVSVVLPLGNVTGENMQAAYFDENGGKMVPVPVDTQIIEKDGQTYALFLTNHFSKYGVICEKPETPHYYGGVILPVATKTDATETDVQETTTATDRIIAGVEATKVKAKSKLVKTKSGKKGIKITWTKSKGYKVDYYQILRSTKKNSGYKKVFQTVDGDKTSYINTKNIKKGKTYYYKVRGVRVVDDKEVYTEWSTKAYRKVK